MTQGDLAYMLISLIFMTLWLVTIFLVVSTAGKSERKRFQAFADRLEDGRLETPTGFQRLTQWASLVVEGTMQGRRVRLSDVRNMLRYEVRVPHGSNVDIRKDDLLERLEVGQQDSQAAEMRVALQHLFGVLGFTRICLRDGWLQVQRASFNYAMTEASLNRVFGHLIKIAPLCERVEVVVKGVAAKGWTGGGKSVLCPYCRDGLDPEQAEGIKVCESCGTLHHDECYREASGCTIFACAGSRGAAAREVT